MAHAVDLHHALIDLCSVLPLVLPGSLALQETEAGLTVYYETPPSPVRTRHGVECVFASLVAHARHCTRSSFPLQAVEFANPPPARPPVYDEFYGVPVGWEAERSSVAFDHATLRLPMSAANSPLSRLLMQHAEETLGAVPLVERQVVRAILAALNVGEATIAATAREMGVSVRTLQRRLDVAEVSFTDLRARVLRSRAERMLRDTELSVEEIGDACGYSSRTGFDRAFRAWTGMTPATFRRGR